MELLFWKKNFCDEFLKKNNNLNLYFVDDDEKNGKFYKKKFP